MVAQAPKRAPSRGKKAVQPSRSRQREASLYVSKIRRASSPSNAVWLSGGGSPRRQSAVVSKIKRSRSAGRRVLTSRATSVLLGNGRGSFGLAAFFSPDNPPRRDHARLRRKSNSRLECLWDLEVGNPRRWCDVVVVVAELRRFGGKTRRPPEHQVESPPHRDPGTATTNPQEAGLSVDFSPGRSRHTGARSSGDVQRRYRMLPYVAGTWP